MTGSPLGASFIATIPPLSPIHGNVQVVITISCPLSSPRVVQFDLYVDPSGTVRSPNGNPIQGATVTLFRAESLSDTFELVPDTSAFLSIATPHNPEQSDPNGHFGWDVVAGLYKVRAEKAGCSAPDYPSQTFAETAILIVPPPVTDLDVRLNCGSSNIAPIVSPPTATSVDEGASFLGSGSFTDADSTSWSATVDYGDASGTQTLALSSQTFSLSHVYRDNGVYTATVTVTDDSGAQGSGTTTVTVNDVLPKATFNALASVNEGDATLLSLSNPTDVPADLPTLQYAFDCGAGYGAFGSNNSASCPTADNGSRVVKGEVKDKDGGATEYTANVTILNVAPAVSNDHASQAVQYSDTIGSVGITAADVAADMPGLAATTSFKKDAGSFQVGLPTGLTLTPVGSAGTWSLAGRAQVAPGAYTVRVTVTDKDGGAGNTDVGITVVAEDARVTYTGAMFASTASATTNAATVTLSATIQDITAVTGDPAFDPDAGDIRNATVTFVDRDHANAVLCTAPIGLVSATDSKTGTATCNWAANLGTQDSASYTIGVIVGGFYIRNSSADDAVATVAKPLTTSFITGGGTLLNQASAGMVPSAAGQKTNFGFNVKYNKSGANLQGQVNIIVRNGGHTYQIKSNSITSLAAESTTGTATFNGKASIQDITDPLNPVSVDGNASLQLTLTDRGEPGTSDSIAITLWNKAGGLWFASAWDGAKTIEQALNGGNLVVR